MVNNYVKAYPKYKQQAFERIADVLIKLFKEVNFFEEFSREEDKGKFVLCFDKDSFPGEYKLANGGIVRSFNVLFEGRRCLTIRSRSVLYTSYTYNWNKLTEKDYKTIYENLEILHRFAGSSDTTIQMKIGPIEYYAISYNVIRFDGKWGSVYKEKRSLAR